MKALMNCTLVIPGPNRGVRAADQTKATYSTDTATAVAMQPKWQVQLIATKGAIKDEYNYIGASAGADEKLESPSCFENYVDLYLTDDNSGVYAGYFKKNTAVGQEWKLNVATDKAGVVEVKWTGIDTLPANIKLVLVDEDGQTTDLVPGGVYKFTASEGGLVKTFRLVIKKA